MDTETSFLSGLLELQYGQDVVNKLKKIAVSVDWAKGWPQDKVAFWNAEAFMWGHKISLDKRKLIGRELERLGDKNLDLGCGAYSYVKSVGFDVSPKMLDFNENLVERVAGDLEEKLPFSDREFDSVTAVFVLNYVKNYELLLSEVYRIVKKDFIVVLSSKQVNDWQRQKEVNLFSSSKWRDILSKYFLVEFKEKEKLWFFNCNKRKT
jgi:ubiquinone/menaquinone biosynthesis C-methylase UbiE